MHIERLNDVRVRLVAPYHPQAVEALRAFAKWDGVGWTGRTLDVERFVAVCKEVWGFDPTRDVIVERVSVDVHLSPAFYGRELWLDRQVAARPFRDSAVRLGDDVTIISGGFAPRGGSAKYPELAPRPNTVLRVRGMARTVAERWAEKYNKPDESVYVEIVAEQAPAAQVMGTAERFAEEIKRVLTPAEIERLVALLQPNEAVAAPR